MHLIKWHMCALRRIKCLGVIAMRRRTIYRTRPKTVLPDEQFFSLLLGGSFLLGGVLGFLISFTGAHNAELADYLLDYFFAVGAAESWSISVLSGIWNVLRWPFFAFLLGISKVGLVAIPALLFFRAFLLSNAISVFMTLFQLKGLVVSLVVFAIPTLLIVPLIYAIGCECMRTLVSGGRGIFLWLQREKLFLLLNCFLCVCAAIVLQQRVMPLALSAVCQHFFIF